MRLYTFIYFLGEDLEKVKESLGDHITYWRKRKKELEFFRNGPFADKSGGLIIFSSSGFYEAEKLVNNDPLITEKVLKNYWLKEWIS